MKGIDKIRQYIGTYKGNYVIIGGTDCNINLVDANIVRRATKDIDRIMVCEALTPEFLKNFGDCIKAGGYSALQVKRMNRLTEKEADILLRKDLKKFLLYYEMYGVDSLILAVLTYNCGTGKVIESSVLQKLQSGNRNILKDYLSYCHYKGKFHPGLYRRRFVEYNLLFKKK